MPDKLQPKSMLKKAKMQLRPIKTLLSALSPFHLLGERRKGAASEGSMSTERNRFHHLLSRGLGLKLVGRFPQESFRSSQTTS